MTGSVESGLARGHRAISEAWRFSSAGFGLAAIELRGREPLLASSHDEAWRRGAGLRERSHAELSWAKEPARTASA